MIFVILGILIILSLVISRHLFKKWFNHLLIYVITWGGMIFLYELKLLSYFDIRGITWFIIVSGFLSFFLGIITIFTAKASLVSEEKKEDSDKETVFSFNEKRLKYIALFFSLVGLLGAIQTWMILFRMFGSLPNIFLSANTVYTMRVGGEIRGVIPYLVSFSLLGLFFSGIYTAVKNKFTIISFIPIIAIILKSIADFSRIQMLLGLAIFSITLIMFRYFIIQIKRREGKNYANKKLLVGFIGIVIFVILGAAMVKTFRGTNESFKGASSTLNATKTGAFISPSVYLYLSSNIGVLNKFMINRSEEASFGENTFTPVYNFLAKFNLTKNVSFNEKGYYIPMWSNSATYLRELYADFGIVGIFLIPYLLGLITTHFWIKFYSEFKLKYFPALVYLFSLISLSWFSSMTKGGNWLISFMILILMTPLFEKIILSKKDLSLLKNATKK